MAEHKFQFTTFHKPATLAQNVIDKLSEHLKLMMETKLFLVFRADKEENFPQRSKLNKLIPKYHIFL